MANDIIARSFNNAPVQQRTRDNYFNATAMCKAARKLWNDYARNATTKAFVEQLSADRGIPVSELIQALRGGDPTLQGTWVHPEVAYHLAQWLSAKFAVAVSGWLHERLSEGPASHSLTATLRRALEAAEDYERAIDAAADEQRQRLAAEQKLKALTDDRQNLINEKRAAERARDELFNSFRSVVRHGGRELHRYEESQADDQLDLMAKGDAENVHQLKLPPAGGSK
jgi:hypothetical protein